MAGPATHIAVGGQTKEVVEAYVAVGGQYRQLQTAYLANGGQYSEAFDPGITVNQWSLTPVSGHPWYWDLYLSLSNVTKAVVWGNWRDTPLATITANAADELTWSSRRGKGTPRFNYQQWVVVTDTFGRETTLNKLSYTPPSPNKPPRPTFSSVTTSSFTAGVPEQNGADQYHWDVVSPPSGTTYTDRTLRRTGMRSGTRYGVRVRVLIKGKGGPWSDVGYVKTDKPSYTAGVYYVYPKGHRSYSPGFSGASYYWRPTSEGIRAGSSKPWAPSTGRGNQRGYIFYNYNDSVHKTLRTALSRGARITQVYLYLRRRNTGHGYGGYDPRSRLQIQTHGHGSQPGGRPGIISNHNSNHGFSRGQGKWIGLPNWMGYHIIRGDKGGRGLSVGGYYSPYYLFEGVGWGATGRVKITIK